MKFNECDKKQQLAWSQVIHASNWVIGGYENSLSDGEIDEMPTYQELFDEIYQTVMTCTTLEGFQAYEPLKEIRFVGSDWIKERIERRLKKEGY